MRSNPQIRGDDRAWQEDTNNYRNLPYSLRRELANKNSGLPKTAPRNTAEHLYRGRMTPALALAAAHAFLLHPPVATSDQPPLSLWFREITKMVGIARQRPAHGHPRGQPGSIRCQHNKRQGILSEPILAVPMAPPDILIRVSPHEHGQNEGGSGHVIGNTAMLKTSLPLALLVVTQL